MEVEPPLARLNAYSDQTTRSALSTRPWMHNGAGCCCVRGVHCAAPLFLIVCLAFFLQPRFWRGPLAALERHCHGLCAYPCLSSRPPWQGSSPAKPFRLPPFYLCWRATARGAFFGLRSALPALSPRCHPARGARGTWCGCLTAPSAGIGGLSLRIGLEALPQGIAFPLATHAGFSGTRAWGRRGMGQPSGDCQINRAQHLPWTRPEGGRRVARITAASWTNVPRRRGGSGRRPLPPLRTPMRMALELRGLRCPRMVDAPPSLLSMLFLL